MIDRFNRRIEYVRVSLTDRCNLRCRYCMPESGVTKLAHSEILTYEEVLRVIRLLARLGIKKVRLTGGEPLIRMGIVDLIRSIKNLDGIERVVMTTNGVRLASMAEQLIDAGLDGINLSLDTLDGKIFQAISRRDCFDRVLEGLNKILSLGMRDVKLNCVPLAEINDDVDDLIELIRDRDVKLRFIELMPIGLARDFKGLPLSTLRDRIEQKFGRLMPIDSTEAQAGPAKYFRLNGFVGAIGFIDALEDKFCSTCNRVRLTAEGFLKLCLSAPAGLDVKRLMRGGLDDEQLMLRLSSAIYNKPLEHAFDGAIELNDRRRMYQVGG
ncbi:MAG: GTP 3',8-cyclase MoaA [Selenomonadaceae bacterium]|nr:GTP 3',8-cyclase MoaA [Selenomonadaceae bacterium]